MPTLSTVPTAALPCSSLQQLVIGDARMGAASVQALRGLQHLTALHLPGCGLQGLPAGSYLTGMMRCAGLRRHSPCRAVHQAGCRHKARQCSPRHGRLHACPPPRCRSLDISGNPALAAPIPFALTAARGLRALCIDGPTPAWQAADWRDLEWKLHCFKALQVRRPGGGGAVGAACLQRAASTARCGCRACTTPHPPLTPPATRAQVLYIGGDGEVEEALDSLIDSNNFAFELDHGGELGEHPRWGGRADFGDSSDDE